MRENNASSDYPEELLDVFKAAALSVTKLYKTSTSAQSKARIDGYQDCLEDLLALLDKGVPDVRAVRRWAADRLDGREPIVATVESEDEVDKTDSTLTPEPQRTDGDSRSATASSDSAMRTGSQSPSPSLARATTTHPPAANPAVATAALRASTASDKAATRAKGMTAAAAAAEDANPEYLEPVEVSVPMQGAFTFRSPVAYPPESYLQLANLDLSDKLSGSSSSNSSSSDDSLSEQPPSQPPHASAANNNNASPTSSTSSTSPHNKAAAFRVRHAGSSRFGARSTASARHGRGSTAGQKRKLNVEEIFDLASLGYGKDVFGRGGSSKRPRQA